VLAASTFTIRSMWLERASQKPATDIERNATYLYFHNGLFGSDSHEEGRLCGTGKARVGHSVVVASTGAGRQC
jgi:hypothetical protein